MKLILGAFLAATSSNYAFTIPSAHTHVSWKLHVAVEPEIMANGFVRVIDAAAANDESMMPATSDLDPLPEKVSNDLSEDSSSKVKLQVPVELNSSTKSTFVDPRVQIQPGRYSTLNYSLALPFFERPTKLDGSHAGDYGFDPFGFTEEWDLYFLQESELRHARLAMLAVVGWPLSELVAPSWMLQEGGRAPSVLNGVNPLTFFAIASALSALGYFEYKTALRRNLGTQLGDLHRKDMDLIWKYGVAGDYNFDPLDLYNVLGDDAIGRKALREMEISHGRYAMVGITYFAAWEALTKHAVVENNPLFHPNSLVPFAAITYLIWSQFYRISDVRKYPIKIEYTKDGEEMLRGIKRSINSIDTEGILNAMNVLSDATGNAVEQIQKSKSMKSILNKIKDLQEGV